MNLAFYCSTAPIRLKSIIHSRKYCRKILFFGSDAFSLFSLSHLSHNLQNGKNVLNVVTTVGSKPNAVEAYCSKKGITLYPWPPDVRIASISYDLGVVVSFGHLIPKKIIQHFPLGMINVHASLLPRWRGASPIIHSIMNGDAETGVTIMRINPHHFDTGDIILQKKCEVGDDELMPVLYERLGRIGAESLLKTIQLLPESLDASVPQPNENVTYAPRIKPEIAHVRWEEKTSKEVYNLYRALYSVYDLKTTWHGTVVKLKKLKVSHQINSTTPGQINWLRSTKQLLIQCKTGVIEIETLSISGKSVRGVDFYNGYLSKRPVAEWSFS